MGITEIKGRIFDMKVHTDELTSRERFTLALSHQETDRVPADLGGLSTTIRTIDLYQRLRAFLGLPVLKKVRHFLDEHIIPDEDLLTALNIDTRYIRTGAAKNWRREKIDPYTVRDEWGTTWTKPPHFTYASVSDNPLKDTTIDALQRYPFPDPEDPGRYEGVKEKAIKLYKETQYAIVADYPTGAGVFDQAWRLRGMAELLLDMLERAEFCHELFERMGNWYRKVYERYMQEVGPYVQMVMLYEDLSMQQGPLMPLELFRTYIKPQHKKIIKAIKNHTDAVICLHICGSAYAFIPDFIEMGIDVLNPVQISAKDMEPQKLKTEFGARLSFHGAVDSQEVLPHGSPEMVEEEVRRLVKTLGKNGGYLLASCHSIQPDVPPENITALFTAERRPNRL
jgi:uroporphyrinogen decarboxylase